MTPIHEIILLLLHNYDLHCYESCNIGYAGYLLYNHCERVIRHLGATTHSWGPLCLGGFAIWQWWVVVVWMWFSLTPKINFIKVFFKKYLFLSYVYECFAWWPQRSEEGIRSSGTRVTDGYELLCGYWEMSLTPPPKSNWRFQLLSQCLQPLPKSLRISALRSARKSVLAGRILS